MAIELQQILQSAKHRTWRYFLTGDEPWFYSTIEQDFMWIPDGGEVQTRPRRTISSPKRMMTVFLSRLVFSHVEISQKGIQFLSISAPIFAVQPCRIDHQRPLKIGGEEWSSILIMQPRTPPCAWLIIWGQVD
jgi:hypothetical protein